MLHSVAYDLGLHLLPNILLGLSRLKWVKSFSLSCIFQECITDNMISGRKLIYIDSSHFPNIGITDFEHIKVRTCYYTHT